MPERWEYHTNNVRIEDREHVKRVLNMASQDGWEMVSIVAYPHPRDTTNTGIIVWRRKISN